MNNLRKKAMI